jgi:hypothetical protein
MHKKRMASTFLLLFSTFALQFCSSDGSDPNPANRSLTISETSVYENTDTGQTVAVLSIDSDQTDDDTTGFNYTLTDDAAGTFALNDNTLVVANSANLDFESVDTFEITVEATDGLETLTEDFTLIVLDQPEISSNADAGAGSLRQAILDATAGQTIYLDNNVTQIDLSTGVLTIDKDLGIKGISPNFTIIDGGGTQPIFTVEDGAVFILEDITLQNATNNVTSDGGCIENLNSEITLNSVILDTCIASNRGGGIANQGANAVVTMTDSVIQNSSAFNGGGFANDGGRMTIQRSLITGNQTSGNSGAGGLTSGSLLTVINSTISGNQVTGGDRVGGGLAAFSGGTIRLVHSTVTGNTATGEGGGIFLAGLLESRNSIIAGNTASLDGADIFRDNLEGSVNNMTYNVIGDGDTTGLSNGANGNIIGTTGSPVNPNIGVLADNGGPTQTHLPSGGSVAVDSIPANLCTDFDGNALTVDARGEMRPVNASCDMGSVERQ